eukprot:1149489-Pelagomonas_calceolata.AAC.2
MEDAPPIQQSSGPGAIRCFDFVAQQWTAHFAEWGAAPSIVSHRWLFVSSPRCLDLLAQQWTAHFAGWVEHPPLFRVVSCLFPHHNALTPLHSSGQHTLLNGWCTLHCFTSLVVCFLTPMPGPPCTAVDSTLTTDAVKLWSECRDS